MADDYSELLKTYDGCKEDACTTVIEDEMATAIRALVAENERLERDRRDVSQLLIVRTLEIAKFQQALRGIASCESRHPGDVVSIARAALGATR
jgi:hypothetical protein